MPIKDPAKRRALVRAAVAKNAAAKREAGMIRVTVTVPAWAHDALKIGAGLLCKVPADEQRGLLLGYRRRNGTNNPFKL